MLSEKLLSFHVVESLARCPALTHYEGLSF